MSYLAQSHKGLLPEDLNVVLIEVEMVEVPQLSYGLGRDLIQLIFGQDQVTEDAALRGQRLRTQGTKL